MAQALALIAVVLLALLVGMTIPVLLQLRATLKSAQQFMESTSSRVEKALTDFTQASRRLDTLASDMEANMDRAKRVLDTAEQMAQSVDEIRNSMKVVGMVAPAVFTAVKTFIGTFLSRPAATQAESTDEETGSPEAAQSVPEGVHPHPRRAAGL